MTLHPKEVAELARRDKAGELETGVVAGQIGASRVSELDRDHFLIIFERDTKFESAAGLVLRHYRAFSGNPEASMRGPYKREGSQNYYLLEEESGRPILEVSTIPDVARSYDVNCGPFLQNTDFARFYEYLKDK